MEKFEKIARLAEWLAIPLVCFILLVLFLLLIVRPFFAYLFDWDRIKALRVVQAARQEKAGRIDAAADVQDALGDDESAEQEPGAGDERQIMGRLAESDPEKAGSLVKQWLRKDRS